MIIEKNKFFSILNSTIFGSDKEDLLKKLAESPDRYVGLFRPTKPKTKIFQNLSQSHEIRFGDAMETVIEEMLKEKYSILPKNNLQYNGDFLNIDQLFVDTEQNIVYFCEQKIRDDHDSTKKRGQLDNFEKKLCYLRETYQNYKIIGIMYFIDPNLSKNRKFYELEINNMSQVYNVELYLFYGRAFFDYIFGPNYREDLENLLKEWKNSLQDFPIVNYDLNPQETIAIVNNLPIRIVRKFIQNHDLWEEGVIRAIFPNGTSLFALSKLLEQKSFQDRSFSILNNLLLENLTLYYSLS